MEFTHKLMKNQQSLNADIQVANAYHIWENKIKNKKIDKIKFNEQLLQQIRQDPVKISS